ncbi:MAG TPA: valine--tRNA ligase [Gemmatimonadaceae bacterium]|nr:valine--tRNA ligase [Gemmatimonadaceae bacterium]
MALPDRFDPTAESKIYEQWLDAACFRADAKRSTRIGGDREPFTIVIPPPNVTAILHLGHALDEVPQDVLIRWARMKGQETLWVAGTDHAGIATQNVVEKQLAKEGKTRFDVGRVAFVKRTEQFVAETGGVILRQLRAIGASADWSRTAYTLSPELSVAVREAFVRLYEDSLIYKGHRVIHWCPRCLTSLSDEEAEFEEETGAIYHVRYRFSNRQLTAGAAGAESGLIIATTRPETMLGDVAVAVNPSDERYRALIGTTVRLPVLDIDIPVIADEYADPQFGTGVVKITPAHDANDFEVGKRHHLAMPVVIDEHGIMAEGADAKGRVPDFVKGDDRFAARKKIVKALQDSGALVKTEQHQHNVRHCYRCDTVIEPRLSDQWFVKMEPLAKPALEGVRSGAIRILPQKWEGVYVHWLENIRDWNISRQLWWGHRIPVWYCKDCDPPYDMHVSRTDLTACPHCGGPVRQDDDVLDTWFSSWLWPLSTLGWPDTESEDFKAFYPTDVLVSGPDIIFFWVSRMIMAGYQFVGRSPYHTVLFHGIARDAQHRKMSKSLGNGLDPLEVVHLYGADAMRWTLISGMGLGADVTLDPNDLEKTFAPGRNFVTKLWNVGRFLLEKAGSAAVTPIEKVSASKLQRVDHWILWRLDQAIADCDAALGPLRPTTALNSSDRVRWTDAERYNGMRLNDLAETARRFVWNELADWYVEAIKARLADGGDDAEVARAVLVHVFDSALRLLHPVVPFVTEAIWQQLPSHKPDTFLPVAIWPTALGRADAHRAREFDLVRETVGALRQIRAEYAVPPVANIDAVVVPADGNGSQIRAGDVFALTGVAGAGEATATVARLAKATLTVSTSAPAGAAAHAVLTGGTSLVVPLAGLVDVERECTRLRGELESLEKQLQSLESRLNNEKFVSKAPPDVVAGERAKLGEWSARRQQLREKVRALCGV